MNTTAHFTWLDLQAPQIQQAIQTPTACLLLIDPQQHNADALARQLIAASLCENKQSGGCGNCQACRLRIANTHPDIITAQDILNVESVRELIAKISQTPSISAHRFIYLKNIDRYHENALNALLKTLEEPSKHNHFILSAQSRRAVKATILSRAQTYQVPQPNATQAVEYLIAQGIAAEQAQQLISLYRNPFLAYTQREQKSPLQLFSAFIRYCAQPRHERQFLHSLDSIAPEQLLEQLCFQCEQLIRWIQLDSPPQNWHNHANDEALLEMIDINRIHHFYAALCQLRRNRQALNWSLQSKTLLLHHMETRNPSL